MVRALLQGPLFSAWVVTSRISLTRNDLPIADTRPNVSFSLSCETSAVTSAIVENMKRLYQLPVDMVSDRFGCPILSHDEFVAKMNASLERIYNGCGREDDIDHMPVRLASSYRNKY